MSEYDDDLDFDTEATGSDLVKQLRKQVNELSKALKERDAEIEQYYAMSRDEEIASALQEMGVNPKISAFVPDSVEDLDDLENWLGEYGEVFGISFTDDASSYDDPSIQAIEQMAAIEDGGVDPTIGFGFWIFIAAYFSRHQLRLIWICWCKFNYVWGDTYYSYEIL